MRRAIAVLLLTHVVPTFGGLIAANGLMSMNGLISVNGLATVNGLGTINGLPTVNGLPTTNGIPTINGETTSNPIMKWNALFRPSRFSAAELGSNWIEGANGTMTNRISWDNRHIHEELKEMLCEKNDANDNKNGATSFQVYFSTLLELAWPPNATLSVCCDRPTGANATAACDAPNVRFDSRTDDTYPLPVWAPHFLTDQFAPGEQEALTAAVIAEFNVLGKHVVMDLHGRFDLGAGTYLVASDVVVLLYKPLFTH
jgi:hypothetical protein